MSPLGRRRQGLGRQCAPIVRHPAQLARFDKHNAHAVRRGALGGGNSGRTASDDAKIGLVVLRHAPALDFARIHEDLSSRF